MTGILCYCPPADLDREGLLRVLKLRLRLRARSTWLKAASSRLLRQKYQGCLLGCYRAVGVPGALPCGASLRPQLSAPRPRGWGGSASRSLRVTCSSEGEGEPLNIGSCSKGSSTPATGEQAAARSPAAAGALGRGPAAGRSLLPMPLGSKPQLAPQLLPGPWGPGSLQGGHSSRATGEQAAARSPAAAGGPGGPGS